jgi:RIO kinase 1
VAAAVFQQAFIPTRMDEVMHFERDHEDAQAGEDLEDRGVFYQTIMGLKPDMSGPRQQPSILEEGGGVAAPRGATSAANAAAGEAQRRPTGAALVAQQMRDFGKADQR